MHSPFENMAKKNTWICLFDTVLSCYLTVNRLKRIHMKCTLRGRKINCVSKINILFFADTDTV